MMLAKFTEFALHHFKLSNINRLKDRKMNVSNGIFPAQHCTERRLYKDIANILNGILNTYQEPVQHSDLSPGELAIPRLSSHGIQHE